MVNTKKIIGLILIILTTYSCKVYKKVYLPSQNGIQGYHGTNQTIKHQMALTNAQRLEVYQAEKAFIKNGDDLGWGLAMSGGGIRSATYNFGALKALYDLGLFQKMQIISSVSGGSYMSYGLYTNYENHKNKEKPFGYYSFSDSVFLQETCSKQSLGNFVINGKYALAIMSPPKLAFNIYKKEIQRGYGHKLPLSYKINSLNPEIKRGDAPYFIINTTLAAKKESDWLNRVVEFTPAYFGNPEIGFTKWNNNNTLDWSEATTTSAAALKFKLLNKVPYNGSAISKNYLALSDGGHSENLAAIGLIRRGVKNIIIIDAEHNKNYSFDGYLILKHKLQKELNLNLDIKAIDDFLIQREVDPKTILKTAVHKGTISSIPLEGAKQELLTINIYYVKMSMPQNMLAQRRDKGKVNGGAIADSVFKNTTCVKRNEKRKCKNYNCSPLANYITPDINNLALYWVNSYATFLNNKKKWKRIGYTFPHTTTADQSFYRDQLAAFIGLGYLQALELEEMVLK
ncbi:patatin-like phospholipase family protein [Flavivirga abyssicola]|uniref:patatin-like phospholipase family protein n=1 Tax=Flavivirga abyssicola TaxID=3063533 RepID=UPI0026E0581C|nr:patatin-like phospholipase family protein [Flavivirga sp. MEBiC07777]WVK14067.1 patatin-like phospholipase family protein [Flavivirga sp. MEBiC07777]